MLLSFSFCRKSYEGSSLWKNSWLRLTKTGTSTIHVNTSTHAQWTPTTSPKFWKDAGSWSSENTRNDSGSSKAWHVHRPSREISSEYSPYWETTGSVQCQLKINWNLAGFLGNLKQMDHWNLLADLRIIWTALWVYATSEADIKFPLVIIQSYERFPCWKPGQSQTLSVWPAAKDSTFSSSTFRVHSTSSRLPLLSIQSYERFALLKAWTKCMVVALRAWPTAKDSTFLSSTFLEHSASSRFPLLSIQSY